MNIIRISTNSCKVTNNIILGVNRMNNVMIQLAADNVYVLPKVATVLHETHDYDIPLLKEAMRENNPVFVVSNDVSRDDLDTNTPYRIGTVVKIERIEHENSRY